MADFLHHHPPVSDAERGGHTMQAPPLGRWTREWCQNGFARKEIVQYGLDAMRADVLMYERHVARDPSNEVFQDWLRHTRRALAELEAWVNAQQGAMP